MSLAIVGADFPNKSGPARRFEIAMCQRGEPVTLKREPRNLKDERAIGVYSARDIQIGYVEAEKSQWIGAQMDNITAVFQRADTWGAVIRVTFDGSVPVLPPETRREVQAARQREWLPGDEDPWPPPFPDDDFADV